MCGGSGPLTPLGQRNFRIAAVGGTARHKHQGIARRARRLTCVKPWPRRLGYTFGCDPIGRRTWFPPQLRRSI